jgi:aspartyl-tRNA(Asn)/glutamyl-tRNA(Gln) amidotransferase subunit C
MTSPLTKVDVKRIARLAHLELNDDEQALFTQQLTQILEYAKRLQAVDTTNVETTWHPGAKVEPLRPDTRHSSLTTDDALANAPAPGPRGLFRVPKVIG